MLLRLKFFRGFELGSLNLVEHYKDKHRFSFLFHWCPFFLCTNMEHGAISAVMHSHVFKEELYVDYHAHFCVLAG